VQGTLEGPFDVELDTGEVAMTKVAADLTVSGPRLPRQGVRATLAGEARLDLRKEALALRLAGKVGESNVKALLTAAGLTKPAYTFAVDLDQLDLDRYMAAKGGERKGSEAQAPGQHLLEPLTHLPASGTLKIGLLKTSHAQARDVRLVLK
jgi:AsmA protein